MEISMRIPEEPSEIREYREQSERDHYEAVKSVEEIYKLLVGVSRFAERNSNRTELPEEKARRLHSEANMLREEIHKIVQMLYSIEHSIHTIAEIRSEVWDGVFSD